MCAYWQRARLDAGKEVIVKTKRGYQVLSESGKPLSADNLSEAEAKKRLAQVEWFKNRGQRGK